jgi:hypothetical protein
METFLLKTSQSKSFNARVMSSQSCEIQNLKKSKKFKTFTKFDTSLATRNFKLVHDTLLGILVMSLWQTLHLKGNPCKLVKT